MAYLEGCLNNVLSRIPTQSPRLHVHVHVPASQPLRVAGYAVLSPQSMNAVI